MLNLRLNVSEVAHNEADKKIKKIGFIQFLNFFGQTSFCKMNAEVWVHLLAINYKKVIIIVQNQLYCY